MNGEDRRADRVLLDTLVADLVAIGERMEHMAARFEEVAVLTSRVDAIERRQKDVIGPEGLLSRVGVLEATQDDDIGNRVTTLETKEGRFTWGALTAVIAVLVSILTLAWMTTK